MTHRKIVAAVTVLAVVGVLAVGRSTFAEDGTTSATPTDSTSSSPTTSDSSSTKFQQRVATRRAELKQKVQDLRTTRKEELSAKRLQICEKRQTKVNQIFTNATARNKKHLALFEKIETKVEQFYQNKKLSSDDYAAAVSAADDKKAAAQAAIDASEGVTFDCQATDGAHPGSAIKAAMTSRHQALKAYRTSLVNLITVVKHALQATSDSSASATTNATTEEQ